jgi:tRNA(Ile)-lysidine synthetase-like protein
MFTKYNDICESCTNSLPKLFTGKLGKTFRSFFKGVHIPKLCVSLSGGVDSMVTSWCLKQILKNTELCAVHINYNNRESSTKESDFVQEWCNTIDIPLYTTSLDITRESFMKKDRHYYETETKRIRFDSYKIHNCPIVLGHNLDDCIENIITNISSCKNFDHLKGMNKTCTIDSVEILRPMLDVPKKEIYEFAKCANVPYLKDSTPLWSRRGKLRDFVIPTLTEHEPGFVRGILKLATLNCCMQDHPYQT